MKTLKFLIQKEIKQIVRDTIMFGLILIFPVLVMVMLPWAVNFEVKNIKIDIVDYSKGEYSYRLANKVKASPYFTLQESSVSYKQAFDQMNKGTNDIIIEIPPDFDKNLVKNKTAKVMIAANSVNGTQGLLGSNYIIEIINSFSNEIRQENGLLEISNTKPTPIIDVKSNYRYNSNLDYKTYMLPAFIVLLVALICGILPSINIVTEKEKGTIKQINVTPVNKFVFLLGKLIPHWVIGLIILVLSMIVTWLVYGLVPAGSLLTIFFTSLVFIIGISGLGVIVANYSSNLQQSSFLFLFIILIIILLSDLFTNSSGMPWWAQIIVKINPITYYTNIMRKVYLIGSSFADILPSFLILILFAIILNLWAILSYKKVSND